MSTLGETLFRMNFRNLGDQGLDYNGHSVQFMQFCTLSFVASHSLVVPTCYTILFIYFQCKESRLFKSLLSNR